MFLPTLPPARRRSSQLATNLIAIGILLTGAGNAFSQSNQCTVSSGAHITPVIELYTSEGCSSCPPADKWASTFKDKVKNGGAVVQAFHVGYWDQLGWVDRFAAPAYTSRQRDIAAKNKLRNIYTPQAVMNGKDWPNWAQGTPSGASPEPARASIALKQLASDQYEASVTSLPGASSPTSWSAYWTVTEHGHQSKVQAGENSGELLKHDFVVRQYTQAGDYTTAAGAPQKLQWRSIAATPGHPRQVNLVVFETQTGKTLQAVSLQCPA